MCMNRLTAHPPKYLYKVLSLENWKKSEAKMYIALPKEDFAFIHFSTAGQLDRIIEKFWSNAPAYVVLKIDVNKLIGKLVFEANPGGTNKYYHLYDGHIPMNAIHEVIIR